MGENSHFCSRDFAGGAFLQAIRKNAKRLKEPVQAIQHPYGKSQIEKLLFAEVFFQLKEKLLVKGMGICCNNLGQSKYRLLLFGQVGILEIVHLLYFFFAQSLLLRRSRPYRSSMAAPGKPGRFDAGHFDEL
jgi:hypothetical protein